MTKEEREAFEIAGDVAGFRCDRINGQYVLMTRQALKVWKAAIEWAEKEEERKSSAALKGWNKFYRGMIQRPPKREGQLQERPGA